MLQGKCDMENFVYTTDTRYLSLVGGDIKTATMLAIGIAKQIEADKTDEPSEYGNYWSMTVSEWEELGFGGRKGQEVIRKNLRKSDFWRERGWGYPKHTEYLVNLETIKAIISKMKEAEKKEIRRLEIIKKNMQEERLKELIGDG